MQRATLLTERGVAFSDLTGRAADVMQGYGEQADVPDELLVPAPHPAVMAGRSSGHP
jgi:hypothetical protein